MKELHGKPGRRRQLSEGRNYKELQGTTRPGAGIGGFVCWAKNDADQLEESRTLRVEEAFILHQSRNRKREDTHARSLRVNMCRGWAAQPLLMLAEE